MVDARVRAVIAFMEKNLHRRLTVSDMGRVARLAPARLRQLFKAETSFAPVEYLRRLRIERAKELLRNSFLSVKEIAGMVGLNDVSHFVRNSERASGVTPAGYRAHCLRSQQSRRQKTPSASAK